MAVLDDIATYLATFTFTSGSSTATVRKYMQPDTPDETVTVLEYAAGPPIRAMGASLSNPVRDRHMLTVLTRGPAKDYAVARDLAGQVHVKLDWLNTTLSGKRYFVKAMFSPQIVEQDRSSRWIVRADYIVEKER